MHISSWKWAFSMLRGRKAHRTMKRHIRSALLGITFSMIPLVLVVILANGMIDGITQRIILVDSGIAKAYQINEHSQQELDELMAGLTERFSFETQLLYEGPGVLFSHEENQLVTVRAVEAGSAHISQLELQKGSISMEGQKIIISPHLSRRLDVDVGDRVTLLSYTELEGGSYRYKPTLFTVAGIATTGYHMLDEQMVYIPKEYGDTVFTQPDALVIRLLPGEGDLGGTIASAPMQELREYLGGSWNALSWQDQYAGLYRNYQSTKVLLYVIMGLIVVAAGVHISSCSLMIILEHTASIGILRSMGVPLGRIRNSFVITGMVIGLTGTLLGISIGLLLGSQLNHILRFLQFSELRALDYYLTTIVIRIPVLEVVGIFLYGIAVSLVSSIVPTRHLRRMSPLRIITSS